MVSQVNAKIYPFGEATIPNLWILLCAFHAYFTALTGIPLGVIVVQIWHENSKAHDKLRIEHYTGNDLSVYGGTLADGYVADSTIPGQQGGIAFITLFHLGLLILIAIAILADLTWFSSNAYNALVATHFMGVRGPVTVNGKEVRSDEKQFITTLLLWKIFLAVCLGSQSFASLGDGNGRPQEIGDVDTWRLRYLSSWYLVFYIANSFASTLTRLFLYRRMAVTADRKVLMITHHHWQHLHPEHAR